MSAKLPTAEWAGMLPIGGIEIPCFVLEDGRRLISGRGLTSTLGMKGRGQGVRRLTDSNPFKTALGADVRVAIQNPIRFLGKGSRRSTPTAGYPAETLIDVANALVDARNSGLLKSQQEIRYAVAADAVRTAFAKVGIIAVIDEVTGYQELRDREALTALLCP